MVIGSEHSERIGLTEEEAEFRRSQGLAAGALPETGRTYRDIVANNLFTFVNLTFATVALTLIAMGMPKEALLSTGLAVVNVVIGIVEESIAKHRLDQIALLTRSKSTVIRDGARRQIDPTEIVPGDAIVVGAGDQIVVDGRIVGKGALAVDESLLTGESQAISKKVGDEVYSGTICVSGSSIYIAEKVGIESFAGDITARAQSARFPMTPMQRQAGLIIRVLLLMAGSYLGLMFLRTWFHDTSVRDTVLAAGVVAGIVPSGLFLMITVTYSVATVRLAKENALIQQINAVESLSNVSVFCIDKTGTLTANRLELDAVQPIEIDADTAQGLASHAVASMSGGTKTSGAILAARGGRRQTVVDEIPFSSDLKWSAVSVTGPDATGVFVLGASEMLAPMLHLEESLIPPAGWEERGLRVLLFATSSDGVMLHNDLGELVLPNTVRPAAWFGFTDELRPNIQETLDGFANAGIEIKVISGDDPDTVAALARQAGMSGELRLVSGPELDAMGEAEFDEAASTGNVFGRISPEQKERLVRSLREQGHYVAMTGDGVNDLLSLKQANLGIAMQSGSQATRAAADIVLLNDSFDSLPKVFLEGQKIRNGLQSIFELFLTRVAVSAVIIAAADVLQAAFPFSPGHMAILTTCTIGIPTFGLALWSTPGVLPSSLLTAVLKFVVPATLLIGATGLGVFLFYYFIIGDAAGTVGSVAEIRATETARSALMTFLVLSGLWLVVFSSPPATYWAVCEEVSSEWRPVLLAVAMIPLFAATMAIPAFRDFFGVVSLDWIDYVALAILSIVLGFALRFLWAWHILDRFLDVDLQEPQQAESTATVPQTN